MDDEDLADAEESRKLQTTESFTGLGSTAEERSQRESIMDMLKPTGDTMGIKLLRRMGWREGQGIGPRVRRKARFDEEDDPGGDTDQTIRLFAPENSTIISFVRKSDRKGLGFEQESCLSDPIKGGDPYSARGGSTADDDAGKTTETAFGNVKMKKKQEFRGGFGVGILNDNGSDDEDPYHIGPQISYNRILGGDKKKKRPGKGKSAANPLLSNKPIFVSKKAGTKTSTFRRCHDGRLPITGFMLSTSLDPLSSTPFQDGKYRPVAVPADWKSTKDPANSIASASKPSLTYQSPAAVAKASTLSPKSRAAILGETPLLGKSVFDFLTPSARSRIASATNNPHLPPALSEVAAAPPNSGPNAKSPRSLIPALPPDVARSALGRGAEGWMPYSDDPPKLARYRKFLEICASLDPNSSTALPDRAPGASTNDWVTEMQEFTQAAQMFKPMTGGMAKRFTSASAAPQNVSDPAGDESVANIDASDLIYKAAAKANDPAAQAAGLGMFGPLTRSVTEFTPTRLLCKRFNVKPPTHVGADATPAVSTSDTTPASSNATAGPTATAFTRHMLELPMQITKVEMDQNRAGYGEGKAGASSDGQEGPQATMIDPDRNEALERERPDDAVFRAVFGGDSDDD
jgi:G patch domain-containing protein 1